MKLKLLTLAVSMAVSVNAHAITYSVNSIGIGSFLDSATYTGTFDLSSVLPTSSSYQINSATLSFSFTDNADSQVTTSILTGSSVTSYSLVDSYYSGYSYVYNYYRNADATYQNNTGGASETANISIGTGNQFFGSNGNTAQNVYIGSSNTSGLVFDTSNGQNGYEYYYSCGNYTCSGYQPGFTNMYYTNQTTTNNNFNTDATGSFNVSGDLTSFTDAYLELQATKALTFQIMMSGNATLTGATLTVDVLAVPEPDIYAMLLAGAGIVSIVRRIQRKLAKD